MSKQIDKTLTLEETVRRFAKAGITITPETVKAYLRRGWLQGQKKGWGEKAPWVVFESSIDHYLAHLPGSPPSPK